MKLVLKQVQQKNLDQRKLTQAVVRPRPLLIPVRLMQVLRQIVNQKSMKAP